MPQLERRLRIDGIENVLDGDDFRGIGDDDIGQSLADLFEPEFQRFARKQPDGSATQVVKAALFVLLDHTIAGVFAAAIDTENSHDLAPSLAGVRRRWEERRVGK